MQSDFSLGEGHTPFTLQSELASILGIKKIYFKDESKNPSGSFKDRATKAQLAYWTKQGKNHFTISSSGNAAASLALYCKTFGLNLDIFLAHDTDAKKLERLDMLMQQTEGKGNVVTHFSRRPRKETFAFSQTTGAVNLLHSRDDSALEGYQSLGKELAADMAKEHLTVCEGIFMPTSSGTGLTGIAQGLHYAYPMYAVQTTKIHPISELYDTDFTTSDDSLATGIAARFTQRKPEVRHILDQTHGGGYVICDEELKTAFQLVTKHAHTSISYDSALSVAGLTKALKKGKMISTAICILTGV